MSCSRIVLPATGGGALLAGLFFNRFFLAIASVLLLLTLHGIVKTVAGQTRRRKEIVASDGK